MISASERSFEKMQTNVSLPSSSSKFQSIFRREPSMAFTELDSDSSISAINGNRLYNTLLVQDRQEMVNRHSLCLHRLRRAADEATSLRRENTSLRSVNVELNKKLRLLIQASVQNRLGSWTMFRGEKGTEKKAIRFPEGERRNERRTSSIGSEDERFSLPKSISVKSEEYLRKAQAIAINGGRTRHSSQSRIPALQNVKRKVYVGGGKNNDHEPIEIEVNGQGSFKTELCNKWQEMGNCPYGEHCQFAHGIEELRPVIRHPRYKTEVCRMVLAGIACPYGHRCHFLHALADQELSSSGLLKPRAVKLNR